MFLLAHSTYLIVSIVNKKLYIKRNIYEMLQILSVSLFDKNGLIELFSSASVQKDVKIFECTASLFDF